MCIPSRKYSGHTWWGAQSLWVQFRPGGAAWERQRDSQNSWGGADFQAAPSAPGVGAMRHAGHPSCRNPMQHAAPSCMQIRAEWDCTNHSGQPVDPQYPQYCGPHGLSRMPRGISDVYHSSCCSQLVWLTVDRGLILAVSQHNSSDRDYFLVVRVIF